jgi:hypothetical protein
VNPPAPYELDFSEILIETNAPNGEEVVVHFKGRNGKQTVRRPIKSHDFQDIFECCQDLASDVFAAEFRMNSAVSLSFEIMSDGDVTVWHTQPSSFLKMQLSMSMHWSCIHLQKNYKSFTSLGLIELPEKYQLVDGRLPLADTVRLIMDTMKSGIEFMGMLILKRDEIDHEREVERAH